MPGATAVGSVALVNGSARPKRTPSSLIPVLQDLQNELNYLPKDCFTMVAHELGISPATFTGWRPLPNFPFEPKGSMSSRCATALHVTCEVHLPFFRQSGRLNLEDSKATSAKGSLQ